MKDNGPVDLDAKAVELEGFFKRHPEKRPPKPAPEGDVKVNPGAPSVIAEEALPSTPTAEILAAERVRLAEPYLRSVRKDLWGSEEPPCETVDHLEQFLEQEETFHGPANAVMDALRDVREALVRATGFDEMDVRRWIYMGTRPKLRRAILRVAAIRERLPDGANIRRREAHLILHDKVEDREARRIATRIRKAWDRPIAGKRSRVPRKMSDLDSRLQEIKERLPEATWEEIREAWRKSPPDGWSVERWTTKGEPGDVKANALRMRWDRLQKKIEALTPQEPE